MSPDDRGVDSLRPLRTLSAGWRSVVHQAQRDGRMVCVKTAAPAATGLQYHTTDRAWTGSEHFTSGQTVATPISPETLAALLADEHETLLRSGRAWRHEPLAFLEGPPPALVLPLHDADPLTSLPDAERAERLIRELPMLFRALTGHRHGDLSETNLLADRSGAGLHLIDPASRAICWLQGSPDGRAGVQAERASLHGAPVTRVQLPRDRHVETRFVTTPARYPILAPFTEPGDGDLDYQLESLMLPWEGLRAVEAIERRQRNPPAPTVRPAPADLLALGIILFRALTGEEPFVGRGLLLDRPAWLGEHPRWCYFPRLDPGDLLPTFERLRAVLPDWIASRLARVPVRHRALVHALLTLAPRSAADLAALVP